MPSIDLAAIEDGDLDAIRDQLNAGASPDGPVGEDGEIPLCWAAAYGQIAIAKLLLEHGADIDRAPEHGMGGPAINDAVFDGQLDTARMLAEAGAKIDYSTAAALGMIERIESHNENHAERWGAFLAACKTGQREVVEYLVPRGIDLTIYPSAEEVGLGASGLHWAAGGGFVNLAVWLVEAGTPIDILDDTYHNTPLGWALLDGRQDVADALLARGARRELSKS